MPTINATSNANAILGTLYWLKDFSTDFLIMSLTLITLLFLSCFLDS